MALFHYRYECPARICSCGRHNRAVRSRLKPVIEVGRLLKRRIKNIITYPRR